MEIKSLYIIVGMQPNIHKSIDGKKYKNTLAMALTVLTCDLYSNNACGLRLGRKLHSKKPRKPPEKDYLGRQNE